MPPKTKINYSLIISIIGVVVMFGGGIFKIGSFYKDTSTISYDFPEFKKSVESKFDGLSSQVESLTGLVNNLNKDNERRNEEERLQRQQMIQQNSELIKFLTEKKSK